MAKKPLGAPQSIVDVPYPVRGIDLSKGFSSQMKFTTPSGINVRSFEPTTDRERGGSRPGISRWINGQVNGSASIQEIAYVPDMTIITPGAPAVNNANRTIRLFAVAGGTPKIGYSGSWHSVTLDGAATLNSSVSVIRSAVNNGVLWLVDGTNYMYYAPVNNTLYQWTASAGTLPTDGSSTARLICSWGGSIMLSGLPDDPYNWFKSKVYAAPGDGGGLYWDYGESPFLSTSAVAGHNSPAGQCPDIVTTMIPYTDDILVMGGDHSIYMMNGSPSNGGRIDLVSDQIGMAWGIPWCKDPFGNIYFMSNRTGIYTLVPGQKPVLLSQQINNLLSNLPMDTLTVRLNWDDVGQGVHVYLTPNAAVGVATHYFWEKRSGAWWQDVFATNNHNPLCCCTYDGNSASDRISLLGSWDGYVRGWVSSNTDDDGTAIASSVTLPPIEATRFDDFMLKEFVATLGTASGNVNYAVHVGNTMEGAFAAAANVTGALSAGRSTTQPVRRSGMGVWIKLSSSNPWQMEGLRCSVLGSGKVRSRSAVYG